MVPQSCRRIRRKAWGKCAIRSDDSEFWPALQFQDSTFPRRKSFMPFRRFIELYRRHSNSDAFFRLRASTALQKHPESGHTGSTVFWMIIWPNSLQCHPVRACAVFWCGRRFFRPDCTGSGQAAERAKPCESVSTNFCSFADSTGLIAIIAQHACRPITRDVQAGFRERLKDADSDSEELSEECRPGGRQGLRRGIFFPHPGGMHAKARETRVLIRMRLRGRLRTARPQGS